MPRKKSKRKGKTKRVQNSGPEKSQSWQTDRQKQQKNNYVPNQRTKQNADWDKRS